MKASKFYGKIKKETEKAILCDGTWIPKSAISKKERVLKVDDWAEKRETYFIQTSFPLNVSGWGAGEMKLELESGEIAYV